MQFGICTGLARAADVQSAGWDFVEASCQEALQATVDESQWTSRRQLRESPSPVPSANVMVPGSLRITGAKASPEALAKYMNTLMSRAAAVGMKTIVFGSGGARNVDADFDRKGARAQILLFAKMIAELAGKHGIMVVLEPLNRGECNIINTLPEAAEYVRAVNHPNFQLLLDSYHFWLEDEPLENLRAVAQSIRHVHLADKVGRTAPGRSGQADYRPLFAELKRVGYDGRAAVEAMGFDDIETGGPGVLKFVKEQWAEA
ncbi:MAG TPA: sugar phosphate isomerase/epimerase family protein [Tepidisphaeraceae bacterium]|nr:sugar phosphate isomerase/epimerase family protein [Tepidisphaeraceae bacterium]